MSRRLRITLGRGGSGPALLAAIVMPSAACDCQPGKDPDDDGGGAEMTSTSTSGGGGAGGADGGMGGVGLFDPTGGSGGGICHDGAQLETFEVELPPAGTPAEPGQICGSPDDPVDSSGAGRVTLMMGGAPNLATGFVTVPTDLQAVVLGTPTVAAIEATDASLLPVTVTNVQAMAGGFTFDAEFPAPFVANPSAWPRVTFQVTFTIDCGANPSRTVRAITYVQLCNELGGTTWVSSGDDCNVCSIIAEMAPSPIVPEQKVDELGLTNAIRLRVRQVARVGRARVLYAENDGGEDVEYAWRASGGDVVSIAPDIVVWTPPLGPGPHQVQAAVVAEDGAAVASYLVKEVA